MENVGGNGLRGTEEMEDEILLEEDILQVIDLGPDDNAEDATNELDMLEVEEDEEEGAMAITPERDDSKLVFSKHTGSVFSVSLEAEHGELVVTGGEDDKAYVWKLTSGEVLLECTGHKDSVTCVSFSAGSSYLATGDLAGLVQVWSLKDLKLVWSFEVSDLEWLSWHTVAPVLLAGTVEGDMWMWKLPGGDTKTFQSFGQACNIGKVTPDGKRCISGYADGSVRVWDLKTAAPIHTLSGHTGHSGSVTSMSCHRDNNFVITGSTDCTALLFNESNGKVAARFQCTQSSPGGDSGEDEDSVETVGLSHVLPYAATGTLQGQLSVWDVPTQVCRHTCKHDAGIVKLCWHETEPLVYTCSLDGAVQLYDSRTGNRERQWYGHEAAILDMGIVRDGSKIVTTSDDHTARVFML